MRAVKLLVGEQRCPALRRQQQQRGPLRLSCALSFERPNSETAGRKHKPSAPAAAALSVVEPAAPLISEDVPFISEDIQAAYEAGYQAGLAAARQAQGSAGNEKAKPQHDSLLRSIIKAFSWRFFSTATTIALTLTFFSATVDEALEMGAAEFVSKYVLFLIHERLWILVTMF